MDTNDLTAQVVGRDLPVSTKHLIEISSFIRGKTIKKSRELLEGVINLKTAVPFVHFHRDVGHKKGRMAAGRYPQKASRYVLDLLTGLEANAEQHGLDRNNLYIKTIIPNKAGITWRMGRHARRKAKRTTLTIIAAELQEKKQPAKETPKKPVAKGKDAKQ